MTVLNTADAIKVGASTATAVYLGATKVWPASVETGPLAAWHTALNNVGSA